MDDIILRNIDAELIGNISAGNQAAISLVAKVVLALFMKVTFTGIHVTQLEHFLTIRDLNSLYIVRSLIIGQDEIGRTTSVVCSC